MIELRIAASKSALEQAEDNEIAAWEAKVRAAEVRQARVYFDALNAVKASEKDKQAAEKQANNKLTQAGLRRMDGQDVRFLSSRDKEVFDMEDALWAKIRANPTMTELEQVALSEAHDAANVVGRGLKK
jgi:precorrin-3B methylase